MPPCARLSHESDSGCRCLQPGTRSPSRVESVAAAVDSGRFGGDIVVVDVPLDQPGAADRVAAPRRLHGAGQPKRHCRPSPRPVPPEPTSMTWSATSSWYCGARARGLPADEIAWAVGVALLGAYRSDPSLTARMEGIAAADAAQSTGKDRGVGMPTSRRGRAVSARVRWGRCRLLLR